MKRRWLLAGWLSVVPLTALAVLATPARPAAAHPLGNFSVNQYDGFTLHPERVDAAVVVDVAEIPTLQEKGGVDADHDGTVTDPERAGYAAATCREVAGSLAARAGRTALRWTVANSGFEYVPGAGGLFTSRLTCRLTAPAALATRTRIMITNRYRTDRVGWREMTAAGDGVHLVDPSLPSRSVSDELRGYPADLLSSALDVRSAILNVAPGPGPGSAAGSATGAAAATPGGGNPLTRWTAAAERHFQVVAGGRHLTPVVALLAVLLALVLGAGHAVLPGHGKTIIAVSLAGRRRRLRDVLLIGGVVTASHTGGVLVVGLLLSTSTAFVGERVLGYLGMVSGLLVTAVGIGMLISSRRGRGHRHPHPHDHSHSHSHSHDGAPVRGGRFSLAGIGLAGGLVPSPSALVVLLGAVGLGRAWFGVLLVVVYGLGMAATLTGAGLLLLTVQRRVAARTAFFSRLAARVPAAAPTVTAGLVVVVGLGLALRAAAAT
jgi:nickel/cobalt transporter (NicO) family protein